MPALDNAIAPGEQCGPISVRLLLALKADWVVINLHLSPPTNVGNWALIIADNIYCTKDQSALTKVTHSNSAGGLGQIGNYCIDETSQLYIIALLFIYTGIFRCAS